jgi:hypothetical protein
MSENILKIGEVLSSWVRLDLNHKGLTDTIPTPSYIEKSSLIYPPTKNILSSLDSEELIKGVFVAYNLLNGDDKVTALNKSSTIYVIDFIEKDGREYIPEVDCEECGGDGRVECGTCSGWGKEDCNECNGGKVECEDCGGDGLDEEGESCDSCGGSGEEECNYCDGTANVECRDCGGDGEFQCNECSGNGTVDGNEEVIDIEYGTVLTQNRDMVDELERRTEGGDIIDGFRDWVERYQNEILILDRFSDTILYEDEWEVGDVDAKYEGTKTNLNGYKVSKNGSYITALNR